MQRPNRATESDAPPLLIVSRLEYQTHKIQNCVREGALGQRAPATHASAMRPSPLAELYADVGPVLSGDPTAATRWRMAMVEFRSRFQGPNDNQLFPEIPLSVSASDLFYKDAFSLLVVATWLPVTRRRSDGCSRAWLQQSRRSSSSIRLRRR